MTLSLSLAAVLFAVSIALGMRVPSEMIAEMLEELGQLLGPISSLESPALLLFIFLNNAVKALAVIVLGILIGLPPLLFVTFNGVTIGALLSALKSILGWGVIAASLAPHGVVEVPLLLLTTALGFRVGEESLRWLTGQKSMVRARLRQSLKMYLKWILGGLLVAAMLEVFVTPIIIGLAGGR